MSMSGQQAVLTPVSRFADRAYLAWAAVATAYAIAFLQRVSPQSVSLNFMHDFGTDAAGVAMLASSYFWGYTLMQIPAGVLVDRYGVRRVVLFSMAASSLGSAAFALAPNLLDVFAARLVVACGDALVFTALLKLVAQSFADERFGVMSGTSLLAFMVGNAVGSIFLGHAADRAAPALDTALIRICLLRMILIAMLLPPVAHAFGLIYVTLVFTALGLVAGGTVPLVLKCTKKLYTADLIGVGASVNTTAAGIFAGVSQPVIGFAMLAAS